MKRVTIPLGVSLELADGWFDITDSLEANAPFALAREDGVGAFQFSSALFAGGAVPNAGIEDLREMLESFGRKQDLGAPADVRFYEEQVRCVGGSFRSEDSIRAWYVTNGRSFLFASHVAARSATQEVAACEQMIRSVEFCNEEPNQSPQHNAGAGPADSDEESASHRASSSEKTAGAQPPSG